jgi:hypothetical protein
MSAATSARLRMVLGDPAVKARYLEKIVVVPPYSCRFWVGAITGRGHGRFWIGDAVEAGQEAQDFVVIAHRFGFGLAYGFDALMDVEVVAHTCDNTICQEPGHWRESTHARNKQEWAQRRHQLAGPLRDKRGARDRAVAMRDAIVAGRPLPTVFADGVRTLDRDQLPLWG